MKLYHREMDSPIGRLRLVATERGLAAVLWENDDPKRTRLGESRADRSHPSLVEAEAQLREYFAGERRSFSLALDPAGTEFQRRVWNALASIPYGETRSYSALAAQVGNPNASRAVGAANGRNPISIVLPCHRVIGANGELVGFAGGLAVKAKLLAFERGTGGKF